MMRVVTFLLAAGCLTGPARASAAPDPVAGSTGTEQREIGVRSSTDQTITVQKGMRIDMTGTNGCNGLVTVRTWNRDAVQVRASHNSRTSVQITPRDQVLLVRTESRGQTSVDYELTVPEWIGFTAGSPWCNLDIDGLTGTVVVETVEGDIDLRNLGGTTTAKTIEGNIAVEGSRGRLQLTTIEGDITVSRASGEIVADSTEGRITLRALQASAVEASTIEGDIIFDGSFTASGRYLLTSHEGDIRLAIPENSNATFSTRTFSGGRLDSSITLKQVSAAGRGRRSTYTLGNGSAQVDLETFEGSIVIRRPGETTR